MYLLDLNAICPYARARDFGYMVTNLAKFMERDIEKYLTAEVGKKGGLCVKFPPLFFRGFPDRVVLMPGGHTVFVETKAPGKTARAIQQRVHEKLRGLGFRVEVLDSRESITDFIRTV